MGDRPSRSSLAGGLGMNRAIREGLLKVDRQIVVLPEEYSGDNIFYRVADLTYDAQFYFLMVDLHAHAHRLRSGPLRFNSSSTSSS